MKSSSGSVSIRFLAALTLDCANYCSHFTSGIVHTGAVMSDAELDLTRLMRDRVRASFEASPFKSYRQLAPVAGVSDVLISQLVKGKYDGSSAGPGVFNLKRIADAVGASVGHYLGEDLVRSENDKHFFNGTSGRSGITQECLNTHFSGGGSLEAFAHLMQYCDQYAVPEEDAPGPKIIHLGKSSLFTGRLGSTSPKNAQHELDNMSLTNRRMILQFHRRVVQERAAVDMPYIDHRMVTRNSHVRAGYSRLGLLVSDGQGRGSILVHCSPIPV